MQREGSVISLVRRVTPEGSRMWNPYCEKRPEIGALAGQTKKCWWRPKSDNKKCLSPLWEIVLGSTWQRSFGGHDLFFGVCRLNSRCRATLKDNKAHQKIESAARPEMSSKPWKQCNIFVGICRCRAAFECAQGGPLESSRLNYLRAAQIGFAICDCPIANSMAALVCNWTTLLPSKCWAVRALVLFLKFKSQNIQMQWKAIMIFLQQQPVGILSNIFSVLFYSVKSIKLVKYRKINIQPWLLQSNVQEPCQVSHLEDFRSSKPLTWC